MEGSRLKNNPAVQEWLADHNAKTVQRNDIGGDRIIQELRLIGFSDVANLVDVSGKKGELTAKEWDELPEGATRTIESISETKFGLKIKQYDKLRALELLARHAGMLDGKGGTMGNKPDEEPEEPTEDQGPRPTVDLLNSIRSKLGKQ